ncbi:hypothetical protein [Aquimarina sp. MMG016]|uniref:hypothetical protein n=1 Tax=Aquimarina sp. MMG016 TaxID=2822690 RepID=UPI001B3A5C0A|nr:hypothetical protein [Aquimarina sp. MMG016]MBQ4820146.1 hypothetical protein [Aquimarina sp. MMG016]
MAINQNRIAIDFVTNEKIDVKFKKQESTKKELILIAENKENGKHSIYVKNKTTDSLQIFTQDWRLFLIQEAKDENGIWLPIEYWESSDCGNSYEFDKLKPKGMLKTLSVAYNGNFETEIRFKLLNDNKVYYSNSLRGKINKEQFIVPDYLSQLWPLAIMTDKIPARIIHKVVFLEPNGVKDFNDLFENWIIKKRKN